MATDEARQYFAFYLMGRDEAEANLEESHEVNYKPLADSVLAGEDIREVAMGAARKEKLPDPDMRAWCSSSRKLRKEIDEAGGDRARAYKQYTQGYIDQLALGIELEILNAIDGDDEEDEDEDEDPGEEDDDGDDDDESPPGTVRRPT